MMQEESVAIGQQMKRFAANYLRGEEHLKSVLSFIDYKLKQPLLFGELTVLHYRMFGGQNENIYQAAASIELMILALDIFDDLQDQDHASAPWIQMSPALSMNIAIGLLTISVASLEQTSFELIKKARAVRCLSIQVVKAVNGQYTDLLNSMSTEEECLAMIQEKSGSLLACACLLGTVLATESHHDTVMEYGIMIGVAAQIKNDIQDICRWDEKNDLIYKKKTLPTLYLLQSSHPRSQLVKSYYEEKLGKDDLYSRKFEIKQFIEESGAIQYSEVLMRVYQMKAFERVKHLNVTPEWLDKLHNYIF